MDHGSLQWLDEVIVLEVALQLDLCICVNSFPVHFIVQPFTFVIALICPSIDAWALPIAILKFTIVNIAVCEDVESCGIKNMIPAPFFFPACQSP